MIVLETLVRHGSDLIDWVEGSGRSNAPARAVAAAGLQLQLTQAPRDLQLVHRRSSTVLSRRLPASLTQTLDGRAGTAALARPAITPYGVAGVITDTRGLYQPRRFSLQFGAATGQVIKLYRSCAGTVYGQGGGLFGSLSFGPGRPAGWARMQLTVTPPLGGNQVFVAQADVNGEFALALDRLPLPTLDTVATYPARLRVFALDPLAAGALPTDPATGQLQIPALNIDELPAARVAIGRDGQQRSRFGAELAFRITPGLVRRITSPEHADLLLAPGTP
ncbi:MAG: hypothetical protein RLY71_4482 [Pseudomonadota bacterium]|jgi:hypothetical protein